MCDIYATVIIFFYFILTFLLHFNFSYASMTIVGGNLLSISNRDKQQTTNNKQQTTNNKQQTTNNKQLTIH